MKHLRQKVCAVQVYLDQEQDLPLFKKYAVMNSGLLESSRYNDTIIASFGLIRVSYPFLKANKGHKFSMEQLPACQDIRLLIELLVEEVAQLMGTLCGVETICWNMQPNQAAISS